MKTTKKILFTLYQIAKNVVLLQYQINIILKWKKKN